MQYAKDLLNRAKELAVQTAQDFRASSLASASADGRVESPPRVPSPTSLSTATVVQSVEVRVARFQTELRGSRINLDNLKRLAFHGIPDKGNLRAVVWKVRLEGEYAARRWERRVSWGAGSGRRGYEYCGWGYEYFCDGVASWLTVSLRFSVLSGLQLLLGYLPLCPEDWSSQLARRRTQYHVFCDVRDGPACRVVFAGWDCRPAYPARRGRTSLRSHLPCCSTPQW